MVTVDELEADPHRALAAIRPIGWIEPLNSWYVTGRALALQVLRDPETFTVDDPRFSTAQVVGPSMLSLDGADHARHRDPFARPFRLDAVRERFTGVVAAETDALIDRFQAAGRAELRSELTGPVAVAVVAHALGLERTDTAVVRGWYDAIVQAVTEVTAGKPVPAAGRDAFAAL